MWRAKTQPWIRRIITFRIWRESASAGMMFLHAVYILHTALYMYIQWLAWCYAMVPLVSVVEYNVIGLAFSAAM